MHRRDFIRLIGGGHSDRRGRRARRLFLAVPGFGGGRVAGPGTRRRPAPLGARARVLAPSSHNRQPWQVDLREPDAITLYVDRERLLPETDPWFRQIVVSQGTFLEAAGDRAARARRRADGRAVSRRRIRAARLDDRPVARISWNAPAPRGDAGPAVRADPAPPHREGRVRPRAPVAAATLGRLAEALKPDAGVRFGGTVDPARVPALRQLCQDAGRRRARHAAHRDGKHPADCASARPRSRAIATASASTRRCCAPLDAVGLFDRDNPPAAGDAAFKSMLAQFDGYSRSAVGFVWLGTPPPNGASRAPGAAPRSTPAAPTCGCNCRPPRSACRCTR